MSFLQRVFGSAIIRSVYGVIAEMEMAFSDGDLDLGVQDAFEIVKCTVEKQVSTDPRRVERYIIDNTAKGITPRIWVISCFCNLSGDLVESGNYHIYRGMLSLTGTGLLYIFKKTSEMLVELGSVDRDFANTQFLEICKNIARCG